MRWNVSKNDDVLLFVKSHLLYVMGICELVCSIYKHIALNQPSVLI